MKQISLKHVVQFGAAALAVLALSGPAEAQRRWFGRGGGVIVYSDINFQGQRLSIRNDVPNLVEAGFNDTISSLEIPNGETWQICQDINYRGRCQVVSGSVNDLRRANWNDRISSMRRVDNRNGAYNQNGYGDSDRYGNDRYGNPRATGTSGYYDRNNSGALIVFDNPNYRGQSASFTNDVPNLVEYGLNDRITSIEVPNGETWEVCTDINYGGPCEVIRGNVADLRTMGWNDRISSMRRIDGRNYRDRRYR